MKTSKNWATLIGAAAFSMVFVGNVWAQERVLKVSNWAEYIGEDTIGNFEKEYGIKVIYDVYDSLEVMDAKLLAGNSGYDVVVHSSSASAKLAKAGILSPVDKSKIDNLKHMDPKVMAQLAENWDPGNTYMVPYTWGSHGVVYNKELVLETYPDAPIGSMEMVFEAKHMKELAKCGVGFLDSPEDIVPMALAYLGLNPSSKNREDYQKVAEMLAKIRPYIKTFDNYAYQRMPQKEFCLVITFGPDGLYAMSGAKEANTGVVLDFMLPEGEGKAQLWIDSWMIPADAENKEDAHLFMNYVSRPEVAAADSNYTWYATANVTAKPMIDEEVASSPAAFPTPDQVANMYTLELLPAKVKRMQIRTWTNFKAGN